MATSAQVQAMEAIRSVNARGMIVAGTSAGASILGAHMIIPGDGTAGDTAAREEGKKYDTIRDTIRRGWKPARAASR